MILSWKGGAFLSIKTELLSFIKYKYANLYDEIELIELSNIYWSFICNASGKSRRSLFNIVQKVDLYSNHQSYLSVLRQVKSLLSNQNYLFLRFKQNPDSSSNKLISQLCSNGVIGKKKVIDPEQLCNYDKNHTIVLIDDIIATGETMMRVISSNLSNYNVVVICHTITMSAIHHLETNSNVVIMKSKSIILNSYKDKNLDHYDLGIVNNICESCSSEMYKFGRGNLGLMVSYEGVTPNNSISMLWYSDFLYPNESWIPLFDRDVHFSSMDEIHVHIFTENLSEIIDYHRRYVKYIDLRVFLLALALRLRIYDLDKTSKIIGYETDGEIFEDINILIAKRLIEKNEQDIVLQGKLLIDTGKIVKNIVSVEKVKRGFR
ncbi:MAG: phosphoribosyltransferase [Candidatus Kapaibacterium sp.]